MDKRGTQTESKKKIVKFIAALSCLLQRHGLLTVVGEKWEDYLLLSVVLNQRN